MDYLEMVEELRVKANVSYTDAKEALENSNWDMLEAVIYLEKNGKTVNNANGETSQNKQYNQNCENVKKSVKDFGGFLKNLFNKGNQNSFVVEKNGAEAFKVPVTVLVLLCIFAFWVTVPLLIVGLFFNMKYRFEGPDFKNEVVETPNV